MKKLLLAVLVLGGLWLAAGYVIGNKVEDTVRAQVAGQEIIPGSDLVRLDIAEYDKGLFGADTRICLVFDRLPPGSMRRRCITHRLVASGVWL